MAAAVSYSPPWWVNVLHRLPHFNHRFEQTSSDFQPADPTYQEVNWSSECFGWIKNPTLLDSVVFMENACVQWTVVMMYEVPELLCMHLHS